MTQSHGAGGTRATHPARVWCTCRVPPIDALWKEAWMMKWSARLGPMLMTGSEDWFLHRASEIIFAGRFLTFQVYWTCARSFSLRSSPIAHVRRPLCTRHSFLLFLLSRNLLIWPSIPLSLPLQFEAALHQRVLSIPAGSCSAAPVDLQLLSNTYCQASETCNLSFARRRPANSIHYINKKNDWCSTRQELVFISLRVRENAGLRDT